MHKGYFPNVLKLIVLRISDTGIAVGGDHQCWYPITPSTCYGSFYHVEMDFGIEMIADAEGALPGVGAQIVQNKIAPVFQYHCSTVHLISQSCPSKESLLFKIVQSV